MRFKYPSSPACAARIYFAEVRVPRDPSVVNHRPDRRTDVKLPNIASRYHKRRTISSPRQYSASIPSIAGHDMSNTFRATEKIPPYFITSELRETNVRCSRICSQRLLRSYCMQMGSEHRKANILLRRICRSLRVSTTVAPRGEAEMVYLPAYLFREMRSREECSYVARVQAHKSPAMTRDTGRTYGPDLCSLGPPQKDIAQEF